MGARNYTFKLTANSEFRVSRGGTFCRVQSITAGQSVNVKPNGDDGYIMGLQEKFSAPFEYLVVENDTAATLDVVLLVGDGDFEARQVVGTVTVDGVAGVQSRFAYEAEINDAAFLAEEALGALAANYNHIAIVNESADKKLIVNHARYGTLASSVYVGMAEASESSLATWSFSAVAWGKSASGGADSAAGRIHTLQDTTQRGSDIMYELAQANGAPQSMLDGNIVYTVPPDEALIFRPSVPNLVFPMAFGWYEVAA